MGRMKAGEGGQRGKEGATGGVEVNVPAPPRRNTVRTIAFSAPSHVAGKIMSIHAWTLVCAINVSTLISHPPPPLSPPSFSLPPSHSTFFLPQLLGHSSVHSLLVGTNQGSVLAFTIDIPSAKHRATRSPIVMPIGKCVQWCLCVLGVGVHAGGTCMWCGVECVECTGMYVVCMVGE